QFLSLRLKSPTSCAERSSSATSSPEDAVQRFDHMASLWLDLAVGRLSPRSTEPQRRRTDFLPLGFAHSSRAKKVSPSPSSAALRPASGCVVNRLRPTIAIEATMVAGSKPARRSDMANIGTFKKVGNEFHGEIVMLTVQVQGVRIVPVDNRTNDEAPTHRVYVGRAEIGAGWPKVS